MASDAKRKAAKAARRRNRQDRKPERRGGVTYSGNVRIVGGKILAQHRRQV